MADLSIGILVIGDALVGKTTFVEAFALGSVTDEDLTSQVSDFQCKCVRTSLGGFSFDACIWDPKRTNRKEKQLSFDLLARRVRGVCVLYDVSSETSFLGALEWVMRVRSVRTQSTPVSLFLIGNKADRDHLRQIPFSVAEERVREYGIDGVLETAAISGHNVDTAFNSLLLHIISALPQSIISFFEESSAAKVSLRSRHRKIVSRNGGGDGGLGEMVYPPFNLEDETDIDESPGTFSCRCC